MFKDKTDQILWFILVYKAYIILLFMEDTERKLSILFKMDLVISLFVFQHFSTLTQQAAGFDLTHIHNILCALLCTVVSNNHI